MKDLVEYLVKELVTHPEAVLVEEVRSPQGVLYEVRVAPSDVGRAIGKGGKVVRSLRLLVKAAALKRRTRAAIEIVTD